jgi:methanogenic corrinoid protein MtbC1
MVQAGSSVYHAVDLDRDYLAGKAYDRYIEKNARVTRAWSATQKVRCFADFQNHLLYLQESLAIRDPALFIDYVQWARVMMASQPLPKKYLAGILEALRDVLQKEVPPDISKKAIACINHGISVLSSPLPEIPPFIAPEHPLARTARDYLDALLLPDPDRARRIIQEIAEGGLPVKELYLGVFQPVLQETGRIWQMQQIGIEQEHFVTASVLLSMAGVRDRFVSERGRVRHRGKTVVAACVAGEQHEAGIRMVADFFELDGWDIYLTGANTPAESIISAVKDREAAVVAISSTMSFHLPALHYIIRSLRADPGTATTTIIVGGYPFSIVPDLWKRVGADAMAVNAADAVDVANRLTAGS